MERQLNPSQINPEGPVSQPVPDQGTGTETTNDDQDSYDIFVAQGLKIASTVAPKLEGKANVDNLGTALFQIVEKVESSGRKNGIKFGLAVLLHGTTEILSRLIEMAKVDVTEEQVKQIVGVAVGKYLDNAVKTGKMTREEVGELGKQAEQFGGQQAGQEMPSGGAPVAQPPMQPPMQQPVGGNANGLR